MSNKVITLERHIIEGERRHPWATGNFSAVLRDLSMAIKLIWREVSKAGLVNILGSAGKENIHGDAVRKLDVFADEAIFRAMDHGGHLCAMASEENEGVLQIPANYPKGEYVLLFDPLDGSSNIDANVTIGTIFSVYGRVSYSGEGTLEDCTQPGYKQTAAGYVVYGSSTMLVYTTGDGVHGFTLDPSIGEFLLSHENIHVPSRGKVYSVNEGNYCYWGDGVKKYIKFLQEEDKGTSRPYAARYIGSLVADIHRTWRSLRAARRLTLSITILAFTTSMVITPAARIGRRSSISLRSRRDNRPRSNYAKREWWVSSATCIFGCLPGFG